MSAGDTSGSAPQHSHPHNNTLSRNEKFWVDQVTVPQPPPGERQGVGNDKGGGVCHTECQAMSSVPSTTRHKKQFGSNTVKQMFSGSNTHNGPSTGLAPLEGRWGGQRIKKGVGVAKHLKVKQGERRRKLATSSIQLHRRVRLAQANLPYNADGDEGSTQAKQGKTRPQGYEKPSGWLQITCLATFTCLSCKNRKKKQEKHHVLLLSSLQEWYSLCWQASLCPARFV